jgi:GR25 family glycosyltransferase involved in LPS biosynthesis/tetratricopeptide (TPR) repeat protein
MIVKNESHIIADTLAHVLKHFPITFWVIDDTGSTDGTQQIIRDFFAARGISGELHETAWEDFGHNRSKALEHAFNKTDYVLVWDADDSVEGDFMFPKQLGADVYSFIFGNASGFRYNRNQLFNNRKRWKYVGVLHEYPACIDREESKGHVSGNYYFVSGKSGARSQDPDKYRKDAAVLERGMEKEPDNTRYVFYCANSYKDAGMNDKAIEKYKKVLEMNGWVEEKYMACVHIYELSGKARENLHYLVEAISYSPDRLEAPFELIQHYCVRNMNRIAMAYYSLIQDYFENRFATDDVSRFLFVKKEVGDFYLPYIMIIVALKVGNHALAIKMADMMFSQRYALAGEWHMKNTFFNLQFAVENLEPSLPFLQKLLRYRQQLGHRLDSDANRSIEKIINKHRDLLAAPIKWKHAPRCTDEVKVFFSITTCKRYDLFERTMNSLLRTWRDKDKIDYFFCVDDNSSKADRDKMRKKYPFFKYYMKGPAEKGHRQSMNIIWSKLKELKPRYWIHMEDDWLFFYEDDYVSRSIDFLNRHESSGIHQLLFNRNYAELYDWDIVGGSKIEAGFLLHECSSVMPPGRTNAYWPHYSFRPSMIRVAPILDLGNYDSPNTFFERDYADRYASLGYKSAFFDAITCFHTGKLTSDKTGTNAYTLNNENQFAESPQQKKEECTGVAILVVNLKRRPDRKEEVGKLLQSHNIIPEWFEAVDGFELKANDEISALFAGNDFSSRKGFIGCAMSHYRIWQRLVADTSCGYYVVLEDDITVNDNFALKLQECIERIRTEKLDLLFLGHTMWNQDDRYNADISGVIWAPFNKDKYVGGTFGYIVSKSGASTYLKYIQENGIRHGIDYIIRLLPQTFKCEVIQPHIVFSEWVRTYNSSVDSDIQKDSTSINLFEGWKFYKGLDHIGDDICSKGKKSAELLLREAIQTPRCIAYNTLGFMKHKITFPLVSSRWFSGEDGVYIRRSAVKRIRPLCSWGSGPEVVRGLNVMLNIPYIELTTDDDDIDYWLIINHPPPFVSFDPKRTLVFRIEPWCGEPWQTWGAKTWGEWASPDPTKFMYVHDMTKYLAPAVWHLSKNFKELAEEPAVQNKENFITSVLSEKVNDPGHKHRIALLRLAETKGDIPIKIFGRENYHNLSSYTGKADKSKETYIRPYKYYFMCENNQESGYITEKLYDAILCESLCFYWGAPNAADFIDSRAFVQLDMTNYEAAYETMKKAVAEDWWSQRIQYIREAKQKVLRELNLFSIVEKVIGTQ